MAIHFPEANPNPQANCFSCMENDAAEWDSPEWYACEPCKDAYIEYLVDMAERMTER